MTTVTCCDNYEVNEYLKMISKYKHLSNEEELALGKQIKLGSEDAKMMIVQSNLKNVVIIAKKIVHKSNVPMMDLIQEGNLGLMVAVEKFNWDYGTKFITYATWWIRQAIFKAISEQSNSMKIPVYVQETLSKFSKVKTELEQQYGCCVQNSEVAKAMNISETKIDEYLNAFNKAVSIDAEFDMADGKSAKIAEILEDKNANICSAVEFEELKNDLKTVISFLKQREQDVIKLRFGLNEFKKTTLEEIGKRLGVTKECVRQTELRALSKMKNLDKGRLLAYMN